MSHPKTPAVQMIALLISIGGCLASAQGQETIAEINFDDAPAKYQYSYAFGGYGPSDGSDSVSVQDQFSVEHVIESESPMTEDISELRTQLLEQTKKLGEAHPDVAALSKKIEAAASPPSTYVKAIMDSTAMDIPDDASYDYAGFGVGATCDFTGKSIEISDPSKFAVSFDAKVTGTEELTQSKLMINFVTEDGDDDDDLDDVVLRLEMGTPQGDDTYTLNSEMQSFSFDLSDMIRASGEYGDLQDANITGITFTVQAQDNSSCFGKDADNVLSVDNIKMIAK